MFLSGPRAQHVHVSMGEKKKKSNLESSASCPLWSQNRDSFQALGMRILKVKTTDDPLEALGAYGLVDILSLVHCGIWLLKVSFLKKWIENQNKTKLRQWHFREWVTVIPWKPCGNKQTQCSPVTRCDLKQDGEERISQNATPCHNSSQHGEAAWKEINTQESCQKCADLIHFPLLFLQCSGRLSLKGIV